MQDVTYPPLDGLQACQKIRGIEQESIAQRSLTTQQCLSMESSFFGKKGESKVDLPISQAGAVQGSTTVVLSPTAKMQRLYIVGLCGSSLRDQIAAVESLPVKGITGAAPKKVPGTLPC